VAQLAKQKKQQQQRRNLHLHFPLEASIFTYFHSVAGSSIAIPRAYLPLWGKKE